MRTAEFLTTRHERSGLCNWSRGKTSSLWLACPLGSTSAQMKTTICFTNLLNRTRTFTWTWKWGLRSSVSTIKMILRFSGTTRSTAFRWPSISWPAPRMAPHANQTRPAKSLKTTLACQSSWSCITRRRSNLTASLIRKWFRKTQRSWTHTSTSCKRTGCRILWNLLK